MALAYPIGACAVLNNLAVVMKNLALSLQRARCYAVAPHKLPAQVALVGEPGQQGDLGERQAPSQQQLPGILQALCYDVLMDGAAGGALEAVCQVYGLIPAAAAISRSRRSCARLAWIYSRARCRLSGAVARVVTRLCLVQAVWWRSRWSVRAWVSASTYSWLARPGASSSPNSARPIWWINGPRSGVRGLNSTRAGSRSAFSAVVRAVSAGSRHRQKMLHAVLQLQIVGLPRGMIKTSPDVVGWCGKRRPTLPSTSVMSAVWMVITSSSGGGTYIASPRCWP